MALGATSAELAVDGTKVVLRFAGPSGSFSTRVPAALRRAQPQEVDRLRAGARAATEMLADERRRLENLLVSGRSWRYDRWRRYYLEHPLTGHWARGLIWELKTAGRSWRAVLNRDGCWQDTNGAEVSRPPASARIRLWHPIRAAAPEVEAWRQRLADLELRQPFPQAWRETYRITAAERDTWPVCERVTGQVLGYRQARALMTRRGWNPEYLLLHWEYPTTRAKVVTTWATGGRRPSATTPWTSTTSASPASAPPAPFDWNAAGRPAAAVSTLAFSEAMRDIGLLVAVAGITGDTVIALARASRSRPRPPGRSTGRVVRMG